MFEYKGDKKVFSKWFCDTMKDGSHLDMMSMFNDVNVWSIKDHFDRTLLHISAAFGNKEISLFLIDSGCDIDAQDSLGYTPLILAIHYGNPDIVKLLIAAGADVFLLNSRQMSPFAFATVFRYQKKKAFDIIFYKRSLDEREQTHISFANAIKERHSMDKVSFHFDEDDVVKNRSHLLCYKSLYFRYPETIEIDLMYLSDPVQKDFTGNTALHALAVVKSDNSELFQQLLDNGADVNVKNNCGITPLHVACAFGNINFVKALLWRNAQVNIKDLYDRTPLYAALTCHFKYCTDQGNRPFLPWNETNFHDMFVNPDPKMKCVTPQSQQLLWLLFDYGAVIDKYLVLRCSNMDEKEVEHHHYLINHIARIEAKTSFIPDYCQEVIQTSCCQSYYQNCWKELQEMKLNTISEDITFFNLLSENLDRISCYIENKEFIQNFTTKDIYRMFPLYCSCLKNRFVSGIKRNHFLKKASSIVNYAVPFLDSNHLVIRKIVSYLNEDDLKNINYPSFQNKECFTENHVPLEDKKRVKDSESDDDYDDDELLQEVKKRYIEL